MSLVVATDGSEESLRILPAANAFASALRVPLHLLRVLNRRTDLAREVATTLAEAEARVSARWREELAAVLRDAAIEGEPVVAVRKSGEDVHETITRSAHELGAIAIAIHSHSGGAVRHAVQGSIAMSLVGNADLPVLVTSGNRPSTPAGPYRLVVASDGSHSAETAVHTLTSVLEHEDIAVTLLAVFDERIAKGPDFDSIAHAEAYLRGLQAQLPAGAQADMVVTETTELEQVGDAIVRAAVEQGASAIALSTHGHSARHHLFSGSVAARLIDHSPLPLLLVRARK